MNLHLPPKHFHNHTFKIWRTLLLYISLIFECPVNAQQDANEHDPILDDGWESITLEKPTQPAQPQSGAQTLVDPAAAFLQEVLPPQEALTLNLGIGHLQGEDWGSDFMASGSILGFQTNASLTMTQGQQGFKLLNPYLLLLRRGQTWDTEVGNLCIGLHGCGKGVRSSWKMDKLRSSLAILFDLAETNGKNPVLNYSGEITPFSNLVLGADISSRGASIAWAYYQKGRFFGRIYERGNWFADSADRKASFDLGASYRIGKGILVQGSFLKNMDRLDPSSLQNFSVALPLTRGWSLTLGHRRSRTANSLNQISSAATTLPLGKARLFLLYQNQRSEYSFEELGGEHSGFQTSQQNLLSSFNWSTRRININLESSLDWQQASKPQHRERLVGGWNFSERTRIEVSSGLFGDSQPLGIKIHLGLSEDTWLDAEYGNLSSFQGALLNPDKNLIKMTFHQRLKLHTPGGGAQLRGRVIDSLGQPLPGVLVRTGQFSKRTDSKGSYIFKNMASNSYEVSIDERSLPAIFAAAPKQQVRLNGHDKKELNFFVDSLDIVQGWIYTDHNGNGRRDPEEGVPNILVSLDGKLGLSAKDGSFTFYNIKPGNYSIRLEIDQLPKLYKLLSPSEVKVSVQPHLLAPVVEFRLEEKKKQIVFQEME